MKRENDEEVKDAQDKWRGMHSGMIRGKWFGPTRRERKRFARVEKR